MPGFRGWTRRRWLNLAGTAIFTGITGCTEGGNSPAADDEIQTEATPNAPDPTDSDPPTGPEPTSTPNPDTSTGPTALSFEDGEPGNIRPPDPWYMIETVGLHRVDGTEATDGYYSFYINPNSYDAVAFGVDVDLTAVTEVLYDGYPNSNEPTAGNIKVSIDGTNGGHAISNELINNDPPEDTWYLDVSGDVTDFSGDHTLVFWADGQRNSAYFDNVRFIDDAGAEIPVAAVLN